MPLTPGLSPNVSLSDEQAPSQTDPIDVQVELVDDKEDRPEVDMEGNILRIEHGDGSISISLDGQPIEKAQRNKPQGWFADLSEDIDEQERFRIADHLIRGIENDLTSREDWVEARSEGIKLLGLKIELPSLQGTPDGAPVEGMSKVRHPLLLEAVLRFQANARSELLPTDGPVKVRDDANNGSPDRDQLADALETDMNHFLTTTAKEYYPDTDKMLFMLGFGGCSFKKVYFCPLRGRPVSESIDAEDLIVNNSATSLSTARRVTHRIYMRPSVVKRMQIIGAFRDIELPEPKAPTLDAVQEEKKSQQGIQSRTVDPSDRDREIYECYCELNLKGFEHTIDGVETGLEIPYKVTIDVSSRQVLSIVRNYNEDTKDLPEARVNFIKYTFVPGLGFYDIGLLHILGNTTNAVTAAWRELLDAGMYANFPGFLMADTGARQNTNMFRVPPGGGSLVKTGGLPINQAVMPLPYKEPSQALNVLVENISQYGQRLGGTSEVAVGEGRQDAPVGTTMALIENAIKVLNAVHKRLHAAQSEEFELLGQCFRENPQSFWQRNKKPAMPWDENQFLSALNDFDFVPQADPNTSSNTQRIMKTAALIQMATTDPTGFNLPEVRKEALMAMGWNNADKFLAPPMPPQPNPQDQAKAVDSQAKMLTAQAKMMDAQHKISGGENKTANPMEMQLKAMEEQNKATEIQQRAADAAMDYENRLRDRESRERLAAVKLAEEVMKNPLDGMQVVRSLLDPSMIQRLEANEPSRPAQPIGMNG